MKRLRFHLPATTRWRRTKSKDRIRLSTPVWTRPPPTTEVDASGPRIPSFSESAEHVRRGNEAHEAAALLTIRPADALGRIEARRTCRIERPANVPGRIGADTQIRRAARRIRLTDAAIASTAKAGVLASSALLGIVARRGGLDASELGVAVLRELARQRASRRNGVDTANAGGTLARASTRGRGFVRLGLRRRRFGRRRRRTTRRDEQQYDDLSKSGLHRRQRYHRRRISILTSTSVRTHDVASATQLRKGRHTSSSRGLTRTDRRTSLHRPQSALVG